MAPARNRNIGPAHICERQARRRASAAPSRATLALIPIELPSASPGSFSTKVIAEPAVLCA